MFEVTVEQMLQHEYEASEKLRKHKKPNMTKSEAKRFVYGALSLFLDPSVHENKFIEEDSKGNPLSDPDKILCRKILLEILEKFKMKAEK